MDDITIGYYIEPDDEEFRILRDEFLKSARTLLDYINKKVNEK